MPHRQKFILVVIIQIAILLVMIGMKWSTLTFGTKVMLKTQPVDPWDMFRGDYVILNLDITDIDLRTVEFSEKGFKDRETVYVELKESGKYWVPRAIYRKHPGGDSIAIKGVVVYYYKGSQSLSVDYGIDSYFVPQHQGLKIERSAERPDVEVSIDRWGNSALARLVIAGQEVKFE